jgi:proteic killer suppression protein
MRHPLYHFGMIRSFKNSVTRNFVLGGKSKWSGMDEAIARQMFAELHAATALSDLGNLNSVELHKLTGDLKEFWPIDINGPWRILFVFDGGHAYKVHIHDPH